MITAISIFIGLVALGLVVSILFGRRRRSGARTRDVSDGVSSGSDDLNYGHSHHSCSDHADSHGGASGGDSGGGGSD